MIRELELYMQYLLAQSHQRISACNTKENNTICLIQSNSLKNTCKKSIYKYMLDVFLHSKKRSLSRKKMSKLH